MADKVLCVLTIHGVGFQQAPRDGVPGYADGLHLNLRQHLDVSTLSDDPGDPEHPTREGPVYVQSQWPPESNDTEKGLQRLGSWISRQDGTIDTSGAPLVTDGQAMAHVALVYSNLEPIEPHVGSGTVAAAMALVAGLRYATPWGWLNLLRELLLPKHPAKAPPLPSLRVRTDSPRWHPGRQHLPFSKKPPGSRQKSPSGLQAVILGLLNDVCTYVARNDLRESVRGFVTEAVVRLASREDVSGIVFNAHSLACVVAFDVARGLPPHLATKLRAFVTAGTGQRKYKILFNWGVDAGELRNIPRWINYWDREDPVADPLTPPLSWRRGQRLPSPAGEAGLYQIIDSSPGAASGLQDVQVDNVSNGGGGGLPAHDDWDNHEQFVEPLARLLSDFSVSSR
jgi:hypothetical protein